MENLVKMNSLFGGVFEQRRILVTGDTGFKGSWLSIWLTEMGAKVYGYSLPPKTTNDNFVKTNLAEKITHQDGDISDFSSFFNFVEAVKPEIVFHLAAQPLVLYSYENPLETYQTNLMGTVHLLEILRKLPYIKAAVNVTSDKCYENQNWVWGYRENDPMGGSDPYSSSKGCSELITSAYLRSYFHSDQHVQLASVRAGNVIGGGDWAIDRIVPDFFKAHLKGEDLVIRNPEFTRPWQHVLEPLSGYLLLAQNLIQHRRKFTGGWNFGPSDSNHYSVRKLIQEIINSFQQGSFKCLEIDKKPHEAHLLKLDISKASKFMDWKPALNFGSTVSFTVKGYQDEFVPGDLFEARVKQIREYIAIAKEQQIKWAL
jgi:CDP-glucose 4,6-dehydratase